MRTLLVVAVLAVSLGALSLQGCGGGGGGNDGGGDGGQCLGDPEVNAWNGAPPATLSGTGLYSDLSTQTLADGVRSFAPTYQLWSDGAQKSRWVKLPPCGTIDTSDMDHWMLPLVDTLTSKTKQNQLLLAFAANKTVNVRCENSQITDFEIYQ